MLETIKATAKFIKNKIDDSPKIGIILGTGLGGLVDEIDIIQSIPYEEIPDFPTSTVEGHSGRLIYGTIGDKKILAMQGRFHYYEGYNMKEVTFPVRVMKYVGVEHLFVSNASGGLNPSFKVGDIVVINDHINMFPEHPLHGKNNEELGPRFPDMSAVYDKALREKASEVAKKIGVEVHEGVYVGLQGPTFETPSEYKMLRILGGDMVGMSTVPEVIVAHHMGIKVFGVSIITDSGVPGEIVEVTHEEVQKVAQQAEPFMTKILKELVKSL